MRATEFEKLSARIERLMKDARKKSGEHQAWDAVTSDGRPVKYEVRGIRSLDELEDTVATLFLWVWSYRDFLVNQAVTGGHSENSVHDRIYQEPDMRLCADIANTLKHEVLNRPRTAFRPILGNAVAELPQASVKAIHVYDGGVRTDVGDPTLVQFRVPVLSETGQEVAEGLDLLDRVLGLWSIIADEFIHAT